jgi:hypothetical protein
MEDKYNKPTKKYQRREFLIATTKAGVGTAIGAGFGYGVGDVYKKGRDAYRENVKPYVEKGKEMIDSTEKAGSKLKNWWNKNLNKPEYEKQQREKLEKEEQEKQQYKKMTRRGFFSRFNEHPIRVGTTTGATVGAGVSTVVLLPGYLEKKKVAKLRDEHIDYGKRIINLENKSKQNYKELRKDLEDEFEEESGKFNNSGLENKIKGNELDTPIAMIISSVLLMIFLLVSSGAKYSGFAIQSEQISTIKPLSVITLILSLTLALIGMIKIRKIKI